MKISGTATMHAPALQVWAALNDPAVLAATIPGCERLEATGPGAYRFSLTAGVAAVQGTYSGEIVLSDRREPESFVMTASGAGAPGTVHTTVAVRLAATADGVTELGYDAEATIGGMIAGVGQRMLGAVAQRLAGDFFTAVDDVLSGNVALPGQSGPIAATGSGPAPDGAQPGVYLPPPRPAGAAAKPGFGPGVVVGAAIALVGVAIGSLVGRKDH